LAQILAGKVMPQTVDDIREGGIELGKSAHQGAVAHAKLCSNDLGSRFAGGNELDQSPLQPLDEIMPLLRPTSKKLLRVIAEDRQQPVVSRNDRRRKLLSVEDYPLTSLTKLHRTAEELCEPGRALATLMNEVDGARRYSLTREVPTSENDEAVPELACLTVFGQ